MIDYKNGDRIVSGIGMIQLDEGRTANIGIVLNAGTKFCEIGWARTDKPHNANENDYHAVTTESNWYLNNRYRVIDNADYR